MSRFYANNPLLQRDKNYAQILGHPLGQVALQLRADAKIKSRLSPLVFMTDPARIPDLPETLASLPKAAAIIYRHFGKSERLTEARLLREISSQNNQQLLIGSGDIDLALKVKADGVHFKRDPSLIGPLACRENHPELIITMAAIKNSHYNAPLDCLDGLFVSSIFDSNSPSAGQAIGVQGLKKAQNRNVAIIALGGVNIKTAPKLLGSGAAGLASVSGFNIRT